MIDHPALPHQRRRRLVCSSLRAGSSRFSRLSMCLIVVILSSNCTQTLLHTFPHVALCTPTHSYTMHPLLTTHTLTYHSIPTNHPPTHTHTHTHPLTHLHTHTLHTCTHPHPLTHTVLKVGQSSTLLHQTRSPPGLVRPSLSTKLPVWVSLAAPKSPSSNHSLSPLSSHSASTLERQ